MTGGEPGGGVRAAPAGGPVLLLWGGLGGEGPGGAGQGQEWAGGHYLWIGEQMWEL